MKLQKFLSNKVKAQRPQSAKNYKGLLHIVKTEKIKSLTLSLTKLIVSPAMYMTTANCAFLLNVMENIIANVAQFDNDVRAERSVGGMKEAMHEGRYVWAAPLGYDNVRISGKSNIVLNDMAPLVRKAFETVAKNTFPSEEVRKIIAKEGLVTKSGKAISKSQFNRLLKNEIYAGWIIKFGERHKGNFAPMVTQELFDKVQRVLKYRGRSNFHYLLENPDFPLRRFVMLPSGKKLTGGWSKGKTKKYPYYCFRSEHLSFRKHIMEGMFKNFFDQFRINENDYSLLL